jgi:cell division septal protein FtsQ
MKKFYKAIIFLLLLTLLSTFNQKELNKIDVGKEAFFNIKSIEINNNFLTDRNEVEKKLVNIYGKNIFSIKKIDIENPLKEIDYLDKVEVKKKYPNTIVIKIFETEPVAIFFKKKVKYILDSSSNIISHKNEDNTKILPTIFGENPEKNFITFFNKLKKNNFPYKNIKNYYYFQIGRWDLQLLNNKIIKLPYNNIDEAIIKVIQLSEDENFINYNIIDLRVDGKIIVE